MAGKKQLNEEVVGNEASGQAGDSLMSPESGVYPTPVDRSACSLGPATDLQGSRLRRAVLAAALLESGGSGGDWQSDGEM